MDDIEFKEAVIAKRHKEIISTLQAISSKLGENEDKNEIKNSIEKLIISLKEDNSVKELKNLFSRWEEALSKIGKNSPNSWNFNIQRDSKGFIKTIEANKT